MTDSPVLQFGRHRGSTVDEVPEDYVLWLADPAREIPSPPRPGRRGGGHKPLPKDVVAAARARADVIREQKRLRDLGRTLLGGGTHDGPDPVYVIECEGDMHSLSGTFAFDLTTHPTLDAALALLSAEYCTIQEDDGDGDVEMVRQSPDPEDDRIIVWEVLPSGHRKAVWGFFGWHHSADDFACGQGTLPGDDEPLSAIAMREY